MLESEEKWLEIIDTFSAAALGMGSWLTALEKLAHATGSRAGELIGLGSEHAVPFNWVTDVGQDWADGFLAIDGGNPAVNPFVRRGIQLGELQVATSSEFVTAEEKRHSVFLNEFAVPYDTPYICLSPLLKEKGMLVGLAVMRSASQGEITDRQRAVFASIAPHVRAAVKTQLALEHQGALLVAGAMDAVSQTVLICDRSGAVKTMTASAEALLQVEGSLQLRNGMLGSADSAENHALHAAIRAAASRLNCLAAPRAGVVVIRSGTGGKPLVLDVLPMPRQTHAFTFEACVLVVVRGRKADPAHQKGLLQALYCLTAAEADIALLLAEGCPPHRAAEQRGTSIGTIRIQMRAIYSKLGVARQAELVSLLQQF